MNKISDFVICFSNKGTQTYHSAGSSCWNTVCKSLSGPLHMSPVSGTNFVFCSYGKFNPGYRDEKCPNGPQNTRGTVFRLVSDLTSHSQLKLFRPGQSRYPGWSVHMRKNSSSVTEISVAKTEISVTRPARLLTMNTSKFW